MAVDISNSDKRRYMNVLQAREKEIEAGLLKMSQAPSSPKAQQENDKRMRREIANSNERRRMQCINAGFSSLRSLIPQLEGEKLSKASILQHTTEYIRQLINEKCTLKSQLERKVAERECQDRFVNDGYATCTPPPTKRKKRDTESSDEGMGSLSDTSDDGLSELRKERARLLDQLEIERGRYRSLEKRFRSLEDQLLALVQPQATHHVQELNPLRVSYPSPPVIELSAVKCEELQYHERQYLHHVTRPASPILQRSPLIDTSSSSEHNVSHTKEASKDSSKQNQKSGHHHNYCYRDHPRRRSHQAQLEQQREEERQRQEEERRHLSLSSSSLPRHSTQNLENLVEAIRQIEGDRVLCDDKKLYDEDRLFSGRQETDKDISSVSESDGRDSPVQQSFRQQQQIIIKSQSSGSYSEKYPMAATLLQQAPLTSLYRPGVIVHKQ